MTRSAENSDAPVPTLSPLDRARAAAGVLLPSVIKGAIIRRPAGVSLVARLGADTLSVKELQRLSRRHGTGPVQFSMFGRRLAFVLEPADAKRVLDETPSPFSPATLEKRAALGHFQPANSLISTPEERAARRPFNDRVLESTSQTHSHASAMATAVEEEIDALLGHVDFVGELDWDAFSTAWWRMVRRIVLGDAARDDEQITDDLRRLRERGNWAYLAPVRARLRGRFLRRVQHYIDRAEPGSLAEVVARTPASPGTEPAQQVPQWLFAFDAAAWATFRALLLLTEHRGAVDRARDEATDAPSLPFVRATVLESLRLWPTTPLVLREATEPTVWSNGALDAKTSVVIFAPYFHRDDRRADWAHVFSPELWLDARDRDSGGDETGQPDGTEHLGESLALVPFSGGTGVCPGRNVVLLTASLVLSRLVAGHDFSSVHPLRTTHLPGSLSPFTTRFTARRSERTRAVPETSTTGPGGSPGTR
ncbi:cytochrome P450 [Pseudoclavibacter endophyticus]|uniref:Cytochrome P450 n=1 Tax=Pseudoclavibacter endophyticus TaxID=1778590 RepID=A0A6H9WQD0_9MICO|nr:cytochrome P450 [Pseudoclavibacter endophyticus]KAB1648281.1 cytochrome P450 [Pseudoclavibacter endophyticus]